MRLRCFFRETSLPTRRRHTIVMPSSCAPLSDNRKFQFRLFRSAQLRPTPIAPSVGTEDPVSASGYLDSVGNSVPEGIAQLGSAFGQGRVRCPRRRSVPSSYRSPTFSRSMASSCRAEQGAVPVRCQWHHSAPLRPGALATFFRCHIGMGCESQSNLRRRHAPPIVSP